MKLSLTILISVFGCLLAAPGCQNNKVQTVQPKEESAAKNEREATIQRNRDWVDDENDLIESYIERRKWKMKRTDTGLRYMVYEKGKGDNVGQKGMRATVAYQISLLDGTDCYSATADEPSQVHIGFDNVESGIHEVLTYLHAGDKARVILPSHLAFGLTGDNDKIPPMATVVYDLHVIAFN